MFPEVLISIIGCRVYVKPVLSSDLYTGKKL